MEAACSSPLFIQFSSGLAWYTFIIKASGVVLRMCYILGGLINLGGTRGPPDSTKYP